MPETALILPILPKSAGLITPSAAKLIEQEIAARIEAVDDIGQAQEWLATADALAAYLRHKEAEGPMLASMRRVEARIGQLLGEAPGRGSKEMNSHANSFNPRTRAEFRSLSAMVGAGLLDYSDTGEESPWRASRRALLLYTAIQDLGGLKSSVTIEWYTPAQYIEAARDVLGGIDLDPASNALANDVVGATIYYDEAADGLSQIWEGRVFCNPPYGKGTGLFATKLVEEYNAGNTTAAIFLINAYGFDSEWFQPLWNYTVCFTDHRIEFWSPQRGSGGPANANLFIYLGPDKNRFVDVFSAFGRIVEAVA